MGGAVSIGTIYGVISLKDQGWSSTLQQASNVLGTVEARALKMVQSLQTIGMRLLPLSAAITGFGLASVKVFNDFQQVLNEIEAVVQPTVVEMQALEAAAIEMGAKTIFSAKEAAEALVELGKAGFTAQQSIEALPSTLELAAAAGIGMADAATLTANTMKTFGLEVTDLGRANDILTKAVNASTIDIVDLRESLKYVGPIARTTGTTLAETAAAAALLGSNGIKGCYDRKTDVLTRDGFKRWEDVTEDDWFATVNPETGTIEYQPALRLIRYRHTGKMYQVKNKQVDLLVTPDHRMWVRRKGRDTFEVRRAHEVHGTNVEYQTGELGWDGLDETEYALPAFDQNRGNWAKPIPERRVSAEAWAEFLGYYMAEGSCDHARHGYRIRITQKKDAGRAAIRACLARLPFAFREEDDGFIACDEQLYREVHPLGYAHQKHVPAYLKTWSSRLLAIFLEAFRKGDGDANGALYSCSEQLVSDCQELALKVGWATSVVAEAEAGDSAQMRDGRVVTATRTTWKVRIATRNTTPRMNTAIGPVHTARLTGRTPVVEGWVDFDDEVFCAEVPNGLLIVRRGGRCVVSGNSMAGTALRNILTELINPAKKTRDIMKDLGIQSFESGGKVMKLADVIGLLKDRGATTAQVMTMFGDRAGPAMAALLTQGREALVGMTTDLENSEGTAKRAAEVMMKGLPGALERMRGGLETVSIALGKVFAPAVEAAANGVGRFADFLTTTILPAFEKLPMPIQATAGAVLLLGAAAGPAAFVVGTLFTVVSSLAAPIAWLMKNLPIWTGQTVAASAAQTALAGSSFAAAAGVKATADAVTFAAGEQLTFNFMAKQGTQALLPLSGAMEQTKVAAAGGAVQTGLWARALGLLTNPITLVVAAIVGLIVLVKELTGSWTTAFTVMLPPIGLAIRAWQDLQKAIEPHLPLARDLASIVKNVLVISWMEFKTALKPVGDALQNYIIFKFELVKLAIEQIIGPLRTLKNDLREAAVSAAAWNPAIAGILLLAAKATGAKGSIRDLAEEMENYANGTLGAVAATKKATTTYGEVSYQLGIMNAGLNLTAFQMQEAAAATVGASTAAGSLSKQLREAQAALKDLSSAERAEIAAGLKMHENTKDIAEAAQKVSGNLKITEAVVRLYEDSLKGATAESKKLSDAQNKLRDQMFGLDDIKKAQDYMAVISDSRAIARLSADAQENFYDVINTGLMALRRNGGALTDLAKRMEALTRLKSGRVLEEEFGGASKAMDQLIFRAPKLTSAVGETMRAFYGLSTSVDPLDGKLLLINTRVKGIETTMNGVPVVWGRNVRAMVEDTETWDVSVRGFTSTLASGFAQLAQISDGTFGAISKAIGGFVGSLDVALDAFAGFRDAFVKNGKQMKGLGIELASSLASGILSGISGMAQSTQFDSTIKNALGGALSGAITGAGLGVTIGVAMGATAAKGLATFGIWGAVAGAIVGIFIGVFRGRATRQYMEDVGREWGGDISKGLAEKMRKQAKDLFGGNLQATEIFNMDAIIGELGGLASSNIIAMFGKLRDVFSMLETGAFTSAQAMEVLDKNFRSFADYVTKNGSLASARLRELISLDKALGTRSQAITDWVFEQSSAAVAGISGFVEMRKTLIENLGTARKELDELVKRKAPSADIAVAKKNVTELSQALAALPLTAEGALGFGAALAGIFADLLARGKPITEVLALLGPVAGELGRQLQMAGLSGGAAFDEMLRLATLASSTTAGPALQAVNSLNAAYTGLWNSGLLTTEMFTGLNSQVVATRDALVAQGVDGTDALRLMQPTLQTIWELWKDQGLVIDEATKALLTQAEAQGIVGAQHRTVQEQMLLLTEQMTDAIVFMAKSFGYVTDEVEDLSNAISNIPDPKIDWSDLDMPEGYGGGDYYGRPPNEGSDGSYPDRIPQYAVGGIVPEDQVAKVHANEIIGPVSFMSEALAGAMQRMSGSRGESTDSGGDTFIIQANDAKSFVQMLEDPVRAKAVVKVVRVLVAAKDADAMQLMSDMGDASRVARR